MKKPTDIGMNTTGAATAPIQAGRTTQGALEGGMTPGDFVTAHAAILRQYVDGAEPVGTMPPPATLKGVVATAGDALMGTKTPVLLDKVGERIAFERTGTRLYDALLLKHDLMGSFAGGPSRADLQTIRDEEHGHFQMLVEAMVQLGGDPTAITPCADLAAVEGLGLQKVVTDARTTLAQALHAIHIAELADTDAWEMLVELAEGLGQTRLVARFREAAAHEQRHLMMVRTWLRAYTMGEAGAKPIPGSSAPA